MASLDDIKRKLNLDEMDSDSRSAMFNKFVEKGGKVMEEKKTSASVKFNRDKQKLVQEKMKNKNEESKKRDYKYSNNNSNDGKQNSKKHKRYLSVFLNGFLKGVFAFSNKFNPKFSNALQNEFSEILSSLNYSIGLVINLEAEKKWDIFEIINRSPSFSFEILLRIYNLYKINSISRIQNFAKKFNNIICPEIIDDVKLLYKELLILHPYWETTKDIIWKALTLYEETTKASPLITKSKLNKYIDDLMGYYFPSFHILLNYNLGVKIPYDYESMSKNTPITPEEEFGVYTKQLVEEKKQ